MTRNVKDVTNFIGW